MWRPLAYKWRRRRSRRRFRIDLGPLRGSSSPVYTLSRRGWNPIKLAYKLVGWAAQLATSAFNQLSQYASSPGYRAYCYAELAVSSLAVAATIASTHFAYPRRDDQAELAWVAWLNTKTVYPANGHPSQHCPGSTNSNFVDVPNDVTTKPNRHHTTY